jgi:hypothetical protein
VRVLSTLHASNLDPRHTLITVENPVGRFRDLPIVQTMANKPGWRLYDRADHCSMADSLDTAPVSQKPTTWLVFSARPPASLPVCQSDCRFRVSPTSPFHSAVMCHRSDLLPGQSVMRDPVHRARIPLGAYDHFWTSHISVPSLPCACSACFLSATEDSCHAATFAANVGTVAEHDKSPTLGSSKVHDVYADLADPAEQFLRMRNVPSSALWHRRFGHLLKGRLSRTLPHVSGIPAAKSGFRDPAFCRCCTMVKQRATVNKKVVADRPSAAVPLGEVSLDLIEFRDRTHDIVPTMSNSKYALVAVDGCTRYKWAYPIARKSDTLDAFKKFIQQVGKPRQILTDWGTEFDGQFDEFCTESSIRTRRSCPYRAWQNGLVERGNKELKSITKCFLVESGLPPQFWGQALLAAVHVHNRTGGRSGPTPHQLMTPVSFGRRPDVSHLRVFGCPCYPLVEKRFRVAAHHNCASEPAIFVGYCPRSTGYLCYLPHKNRIVVRMDVRFDEASICRLVRFLRVHMMCHQQLCLLLHYTCSSTHPLTSISNVNLHKRKLV